MIDEVLREYRHARAYCDDIIVFSDTLAQQLKHLSEVIKRLNKVNLKINTRKSRFGYIKVEYLEHTVGESKISPVLNKVQAIQAFQFTETKKALRTFLGMTNYYSRFIKG